MENRNAEYFYEAAKNSYNKRQKEKVLIYMEKLFDLFDKAAKQGEFSAEFESKRQILRSLPNYAPLFIGGAYCNIQLEVLSTMA